MKRKKSTPSNQWVQMVMSNISHIVWESSNLCCNELFQASTGSNNPIPFHNNRSRNECLWLSLLKRLPSCIGSHWKAYHMIGKTPSQNGMLCIYWVNLMNLAALSCSEWAERGIFRWNSRQGKTSLQSDRDGKQRFENSKWSNKGNTRVSPVHLRIVRMSQVS